MRALHRSDPVREPLGRSLKVLNALTPSPLYRKFAQVSQEMIHTANKAKGDDAQAAPAERHALEYDRDGAILAALARNAPSLANDFGALTPSGSDSEWLTPAQVARHSRSRKALYSDVERGGWFAAAASRVGRWLRFNRRGLDRLP